MATTPLQHPVLVVLQRGSRSQFAPQQDRRVTARCSPRWSWAAGSRVRWASTTEQPPFVGHEPDHSVPVVGQFEAGLRRTGPRRCRPRPGSGHLPPPHRLYRLPGLPGATPPMTVLPRRPPTVRQDGASALIGRSLSVRQKQPRPCASPPVATVSVVFPTACAPYRCREAKRHIGVTLAAGSSSQHHARRAYAPAYPAEPVRRDPERGNN